MRVRERGGVWLSVDLKLPLLLDEEAMGMGTGMVTEAELEAGAMAHMSHLLDDDIHYTIGIEL